ncbi:MAG: tRNA uridine-5-carboxymethylaminomethyl(34) synthesis GTPase MnmE [Bacteroidia bacterium]|nr:tRNA uridine-5-carboxymethylaminomethyl(34) synthesis GTPase MnmE [Bacteroidia bacterium]MDW8015930.1 tRNA uridine-5-carboxymethylaminomethyl(34) synthesis GTPase MnmE [Bacteroidia bacterium]
MGDTIVAVATAWAPAAIGIVRISGPNALPLILTYWRGKPPRPRYAHFGAIHDENGTLLDQVILTYFPAPFSSTGEEVVEVACHGSLYILRRLVELLIAKGARLARPGEFTLRAYLNRKLSLDQAEAVADLIQARSAVAHRLALSQLTGKYYERVRQLRAQLIDLLALIELELDFSEEDVEFASRAQLEQLLESLRREIEGLLHSYRIGQAVREGIPVAIVGRPNAGKSTLLNALLAEERAIVSEIPGTTRDTVEERLVLGGYELRLIDTAGLRENPSDAIEAEGIRRAREKLRHAFLVLYVFDAAQESLAQAQAHAKLLLGMPPYPPILWVANKVDLLPALPIELQTHAIPIAAKERKGIDNLERIITEKIGEMGVDSEILLSHTRHYESFLRAKEAVEAALRLLREKGGSEILAEELRLAQAAIGEITGEITPDEVLGHIFSKFCIGK